MTKLYYRLRSQSTALQLLVAVAVLLAMLVTIQLILAGQADAGTMYTWTCRKYPFVRYTNNWLVVVSLGNSGWSCTRAAVFVP